MSAFILSLVLLAQVGPVDYPVGFLAVPRDPADNTFKRQSISEGGGPYKYHVGTDLMIREPDGRERVLVKGSQPDKGLLAVHDRKVSLDGKTYYYSHIRKFADRPNRVYCDLFKIPVAGGEPVQLTNARDEWRPPSGVFPTSSNEQVWNTAPCPTPEGLVFCSDRDGIKSPAEGFRGYLLYRLDDDGTVHKIDHMDFGGVLHPTYWKGRIYFATAQQQGLRTRNGNGWGIWSMRPDGSDFQPNRSAIVSGKTIWHLTTHTSDGTSVADRYYDTRETGTIDAVPPFEATPFGPLTIFGDPNKKKNPPVWDGFDAKAGRLRDGNYVQFSLQPRDMFAPFPWSHSHDVLNTNGLTEDALRYQREVGAPTGVPGNKLLVDWNGDKPDRRDRGVYLSKYAMSDSWPGKVAVNTDLPSENPHDHLVKVVDDPERHEWFGEAVVSYEAIYGSPPPTMQPFAKAHGLPLGSPYGIIGSTSVDRPEVVDIKSVQVTIPADTIHYVRVLAFNPTQFGLKVGPSTKNQSPANGTGSGTGNTEGFSSAINERLGHYEDISVRKWRKPDGGLHVGPDAPAGSQPVLAPNGQPDTSFAAAIPANHPWSFQLLDANHRAITLGTAKTWHQVIPYEQRTDCQGCHNHWKPDAFRFEDTVAGSAEYQLPKLDKIHTVEYYRDIEAIDKRLDLGIGPRPFEVRGNVSAYGSSLWPVLNDERLTEQERRTLAAWCDTGFMSATTFTNAAGPRITEASGQGPYADCVPPTICLTLLADRTLVGACDPQSGLNEASLSIKSTAEMCGRKAGAELADLAVKNGDVWTLKGEPKGIITASIRDNLQAKNAAGVAVSQAGNLASTSVSAKPTQVTTE